MIDEPLEPVPIPLVGVGGSVPLDPFQEMVAKCRAQGSHRITANCFGNRQPIERWFLYSRLERHTTDMAEYLANRNRMRWLAEQHVIIISLVHQHLALELRQVFFNRIVKQYLPFIGQHQHCYCGHAFGL